MPAGDAIVTLQSEGLRNGVGAPTYKAFLVIQRELPRRLALGRFRVGLVEGNFDLDVRGGGSRDHTLRRRDYRLRRRRLRSRAGDNGAALPRHEVVTAHAAEHSLGFVPFGLADRTIIARRGTSVVGDAAGGALVGIGRQAHLQTAL